MRRLLSLEDPLAQWLAYAIWRVREWLARAAAMTERLGCPLATLASLALWAVLLLAVSRALA